MYLDIKGVEGIFRVVGKFDHLEEFLSYVVKLKLKVVDANSYHDPLSPEQVQELLSHAYQKAEEQERALQLAKEKAAQKEKLNFQDKKLVKAYEAIDQIINQIDQVLEIGGRNIPPVTQKKFDDMRGEISKLRLATNYDKIIEELHRAMNLIVETQDLLLTKLEEDKIFTIAPKSKVTNVEVIREQTRLAKANLLSALGAQLSRAETMYVSLGYLKLFTQYLHKDIQFALENKLAFCRQLFHGAELMMLFFLLELALLAVFGGQIGIELSLQRFGILFIYGALAALLFRAANEYFKPQQLIHYLWLAIGIVAAYLIGISLLKILLVF